MSSPTSHPHCITHPIVFSHGNSFPASTYGVMLDSLRARGFVVSAIEKFGHDPKYPVTNNWPYLVRQLADFARQQRDAHQGQTPILVGHSLGGILSLMCAARHRQLARLVVMLDSPVLGGWRAGAIRVVKRTSLMQRFSPSHVSRRRRDHWQDRAAVFEHFRSKKKFARWNEQVLRDYVDHGTVDADGTWRLAFDREIESRIYETLPDTIDLMLRRRPLTCPLAFIGGLQSAEMKQVGGVEATARFARGRVMMIDGTHLFPMEKPLACAAAVEASIRAILGE